MNPLGGIKLKQLPLGFYISAALGLVLFPTLIYLWPQPFDAIDAKVYDLKFRGRSPCEVSPAIVHLDVDDQSVKKFGLWPWDRKISALIVNKLTTLGAKTIVFDIFFPTGGKSPEGDTLFFKSLADSGRVISATALEITHGGDPEIRIRSDHERKEQALYSKAWPIDQSEEEDLWWIYEIPDSHVPLVPIIDNSQYVGHIVSTPDRDGVHRSIPLLILFADRCVPSLSLAALASYRNIVPKSIVIKGSDRISIKHDSGVLDIPVEADGSMLVNWPKKIESFPHYSVAGLLEAEHDPDLKDLIKDKIVIVAYSATGTTDMGTNPLFREFLLSRIHSSALNTMLTGQFITVVHEFPFIVPAAGLLSVLFALVCLRIRHRYGIILAVVICASYGAIVLVSFLWWSYDIPAAGPLLLFAVSAAVFLISRAISMESQADRVAGALERYLSPQMLLSIVADDREIDLSTRRKELTILFVDIKGFSSMSETMHVGYLEEFLNDFLEAMTRAVFDNHGTVDKFLGDGLMAFFGDPIEIENHALAAVCASQQMHREMDRLNEKWSHAGISDISGGVEIRVGINTGMVVVGNIGSQRRMEYTVVGSAVNVASRLQEVAPTGGVLISERTYYLAREHLQCREPRSIKVKGVERPITVCEIESVSDRPCVTDTT